MQITPTHLNGALIIQPKIFQDERGYFYESFKQEELNKFTEYPLSFVQENQSFSNRNVFRGFHFQDTAKAQAKLVRVVKGSVIDIIIDIREQSNTFGKVLQIELSDTNHLQLLVPRGFAHGFLVTSETAIFQYKCDNYYSKEHENGINPFDPDLEISWPVEKESLIIHPRDLSWKALKDTRLA